VLDVDRAVVFETSDQILCKNENFARGFDMTDALDCVDRCIDHCCRVVFGLVSSDTSAYVWTLNH